MDVQVKHILEEVGKISNDTFPKNIQILTVFPNDLWTVLGDPTQLHQVLLNLCVNARDAMPQGGTLTLTAQNLTLDTHYAGLSWDLGAKAGPYVFIQVVDTGTGIPPKTIEKIFDPFFTTKELGKGTGLGLSTSLAILKSHGGFIRAYSELGKGTEFSVYLPAQTEFSPAEAAKLAAEMPRGNGELILIVDDQLAIRQITEQTLRAFGYRVILATDGIDATAIYARQGAEIALVITDMMMPKLDGVGTVQAIRRMNPTACIIGTSGLSSESHGAQAASLDLNDFLAKPFTADTLLQALKSTLSKTRTTATTPPASPA
jgi:CheY-like chemotaxis protein